MEVTAENLEAVGESAFVEIENDGETATAPITEGETATFDAGDVGGLADEDEVTATLFDEEDGEELATDSTTVGVQLAYGEQDTDAYVHPAVGDFELDQALEAADGEVNSVAWSPSSDRLAVGGSNVMIGDDPSTVTVYSTDDWSVEQKLEPGSIVNSMAWSPDGEQLAVGSSDDTVRVYDADEWEVDETLTEAQDRVYAVAWSPDGDQLAYGDQDALVSVHETEGDWERTETLIASEEINDLAWSPSSDRLAYGAGTGIEGDFLYVHEFDNEITDKVGDDDAGVDSVAWSPDGERLAHGSTPESSFDDDSVVIYDATKPALFWDEPEEEIEGDHGFETPVAWSPDSDQLAFGSSESVEVVDATDGFTDVTTLEEAGATVTSVAWSPTGEE